MATELPEVDVMSDTLRQLIIIEDNRQKLLDKLTEIIRQCKELMTNSLPEKIKPAIDAIYQGDLPIFERLKLVEDTECLCRCILSKVSGYLKVIDEITRTTLTSGTLDFTVVYKYLQSIKVRLDSGINVLIKTKASLNQELSLIKANITSALNNGNIPFDCKLIEIDGGCELQLEYIIHIGDLKGNHCIRLSNVKNVKVADSGALLTMKSDEQHIIPEQTLLQIKQWYNNKNIELPWKVNWP